MNNPDMISPEKNRFQLSDNAYAMMFSALFLLLGGFIAWHHEMWRDEIQAWLIARDSASPTEVLYHLNRYDGHTGLWHLCLYVLKLITWSPVIMQPFHLIIAATTVYLFLRFSPFTRLQKALFPFGYLAFYEYAIMCRNYAWGVLFLFLFCTLFKDWKTKFPLVGFILLLLAHTGVIALIVVIAIGLALCWEFISTSNRPNKTDTRVGFSLILFGIVTSIIQLKPSGPGRFDWSDLTKGLFDLGRLRDALTILPKAFFPIPEFTLRFWNTYLLDKLPAAYEVKLVLAILILLFAAILLFRKPAALVMYLSGTVGLLLFFSSYFGFIRHWGYLFMLFLAAIWVSHYCDDAPSLKRKRERPFWGGLNQASLALTRSLNPVLVLILIIHLIGGVAAASLDYKYPFSEGKAVARFIKEAKLDDMIIAPEARSDVTLEILGYLEKDRFYYPRPKRFGSFVAWDPGYASTAYLPTEDVLQEIERFSNEKGEDILVISGRVYPEEIQSRYALTKVKVFRPSVIRESVENYVLYRMTPPAQSNLKIDPQTVVGIWRFDEGQGDVAKDSSGHGNDGRLVGDPKWVEGKFDTALRFDGVDDYVDCGNAEIFRVRQGTMAAWIKIGTNDDSGLSAVTLPFDDIPAWEPPCRSLGLGTVEGETRFWIAINDENKEFSSGVLNVDQWYHLAITYDGVTRRGYLDGIEVFAYVFQGEITYSGAPSCVIGVRSKTAPGEYFNGIVDEVAIFNIALTRDEIRAIRNRGLGKVK